MSFEFGPYFICCVLCYGLLRIVTKMDERRREPIDKLKDALLAYAIGYVWADKIDSGMNMDYEGYDGTMLPCYSGRDDLDAYMRYFRDGGSDRRMAIQRFIDNNLGSNVKVAKFFESFVHGVNRGCESDSDCVSDNEVVYVRGGCLNESHNKLNGSLSGSFD